MNIRKAMFSFALAATAAFCAFGETKVGTLLVEESAIVTKLTNAADKVDMIAAEMSPEGAQFTNPVIGESQARLTFVINSGDGAYIPAEPVRSQLLNGAKVVVTVGNNTYKYTLPSLTPNTAISTAVNVFGAENATVSVAFGAADEVVLVTKQHAKIREGRAYTISLDCYKANIAHRQIGRAQVVGANSSTKTYLIVRDSDGEGHVETKFGHYTDALGTEWFDETGFMNDVRVCKVTDGQLTWGWNNLQNDEGECTWETQFPWKDFRNIDVELTSASGGTGQNVYKFVEFPIYYVKFDASEPLPFITRYTDGNDVEHCSTNVVNCRIWWLCETQLPGYILPPWEKIWETSYDTETTAIVKSSTPKAKNYYARYKSVDKTKTINGTTWSVLQSYPWNGTVTGGTRNEDNNRAHYLNGCSITVDGVAYGPDLTGRRFALTGWNDYMAIAYLTYIHLGPDVQGWVYGNCGTTSIAQSKQDCLEEVFNLDPGFSTFSIGDTAQSQAPFSYFGIVNLWGSEGDQMADATFFQQRLENGNYAGFIMCQLDRSKYTPHETNFEVLSSLGYERLTYNVAETGAEAITYRGLDTRESYWGFWLTCNKPDSIAFVLGSIDNTWRGSVPATNPQGAVTTNPYMCSLSNRRGHARSLGVWAVYANAAPDFADAVPWGARLSMVIPAAE